MWWYNTGIRSYRIAIRLAALTNPKARKWLEGRRHIFERLRQAIPSGGRIVWIHASSLGEFEQGRPVIEAIRKRYPEYKILLTFFSPSGYEIRKNYPGADYIFYLPADTPKRVRRFLDIVNPEIAIFIKYEFWLNYLAELRKRSIRTYVISAVFRKDSIFFRPFGGAFREALRGFEHLFVQNDASRELLSAVGIDRVTVAGDTRFDRVAEIAAQEHRLEIVERFVGKSKVFVAGSTWPPDEAMLLQLIEKYPRTKFIIAPHEISQERIEHFVQSITHGAVRYTRADTSALENAQVLVIDTIGILSSVYRYGTYAYVGGGFGVGIHNTLEAAAYGLPVAFGPNYGKFQEAKDLIAAGASCSVTSFEALDGWFSGLEADPHAYNAAASSAFAYVNANKGATDMILREIFGR